MSLGKQSASGRWQEIIEQCVRRELPPDSSLPGPDEDLVESGAIDSMAWVGVVRAIEDATGIADFGDRMTDLPRSIRTMLNVLKDSSTPATGTTAPQRETGAPVGAPQLALAGWGAATGTRRVTAAELEH